MNETPKDSVDQLPRKKGFWRRQFSWQGLRRALLGLAVLITLMALAVTEENWRGKRDWENYRRELEAKGERLDWQAFAPPTVPDDQNLFTSPVFKKILANKVPLYPYPKNDKNYPTDLGYWAENTLTDFKPWQRAYRALRVDDNGAAFPIATEPQTPAKDVLFALSRSDETIEELLQASRRPYAIIPLPYKDGISATAGTILPYLAALKRCAQLLNVRAIAELADNQNQKSLDEIKLLFHLNNSLNNSLLLISQLVRMAIINIGIQPIYEGLAQHKWTDAQLAELETELSEMDFLADYERSIRCERALDIDWLESQRQTHEIILPTEDGSSRTVKTILMPSAYYYQNELALAQVSEQWTLPLINTNSRVISPANWQRMNDTARADQKHFSLYAIRAHALALALFSVAKKVAFTQSEIDLARVGCALERYRLAHGAYPESLDALEPQFIAQVPHDVINGQPLHYRLEPNGLFVLYSVGWNETDDGGKVVLTKTGTVDRDQGDCVWQYPPN